MDDYIREFSNMLHACEQRARRKPDDRTALSAEKEDACLSCGNERFYKGSLSEIRMQLEFDLKKDPDNEQMRTSLRRIENEIFMKPNLASPKKEKDFTEAGITPQENTYTTPNPFSIKPKKEPI